MEGVDVEFVGWVDEEETREVVKRKWRVVPWIKEMRSKMMMM